jgi:hypothetical protein
MSKPESKHDSIHLLSYKTLYNVLIQTLKNADYADLEEVKPGSPLMPSSGRKEVGFFQVKVMTFSESKIADYIRYTSRAPGDEGVARLNQFFKDIYASSQGKDPRALIQWITDAINKNEGYRFRNILAYRFRDFDFEARPGDPRGFTLEGDRAKQIKKLITGLQESAKQRVSQHERDMNSTFTKLGDYLQSLLEMRAGVRRS